VTVYAKAADFADDGTGKNKIFKQWQSATQLRPMPILISAMDIFKPE